MCFGNGLAKEFFEDVKREHLDEAPEGIETNIFFLLEKADGKFTLGYSSTVQRIEKDQTTQPAEIAN